MHVGKKMQKREKSAMSVSLYGNLVFVVIELVMALVTGSQAVLLDAVYDSVEFCMLLPSIFLIPLLYKPSNEEHPFGYMQIETIFVVVKGITMTAVTFGLIFNNINLMLHGGHIVSFHTVAGFELFACISLGMTVAFLLPILIPFDWFQHIVPYLDQLITIVLSLVMIPTPIHTVITGIRDLMLIPPEEETIDDIKETIEPIIGVYGHKNLYYDIVRTGRKLWISVYISFEKDIVSLSKFKQLQDQCIKALASKYSDFYFELLPDIEFTGIEDIE